MQTRERLLEIADVLIADAYVFGREGCNHIGEYVGRAMNAKANLAQACVALAKEMREAEQAVTCANVDAVTQMLALIQQSLPR
jgi:hypothetical protein